MRARFDARPPGADRERVESNIEPVARVVIEAQILEIVTRQPGENSRYNLDALLSRNQSFRLLD